MIKYLNNYFGKSIKRMVMASFVFVLLVPIAFFIYSLYQNSWEQAEQDMLEKHALISTALVEPFSRYISSRQRSLQTVGEELLHFEHDGEENDPAIEHDEHAKHHNIQRALDKYLKSFDQFFIPLQAVYIKDHCSGGVGIIRCMYFSIGQFP